MKRRRRKKVGVRQSIIRKRKCDEVIREIVRLFKIVRYSISILSWFYHIAITTFNTIFMYI